MIIGPLGEGHRGMFYYTEEIWVMKMQWDIKIFLIMRLLGLRITFQVLMGFSLLRD